MEIASAARSAREIERQIDAHRLARMTQGTIFIGSGSAGLMRTDDPRPWVMVPLALLHRPDQLGRAQLRGVDAIVVSDTSEATLLWQAIAADQTVVMCAAPPDAPQFLMGASPDDAAEAWSVVAHHNGLADALARVRTMPAVRTAPAAAAADAAIEALVASRDRPTTTSDPG
jgi:hypothetical protein